MDQFSESLLKDDQMSLDWADSGWSVVEKEIVFVWYGIWYRCVWTNLPFDFVTHTYNATDAKSFLKYNPNHFET